MSKSTLMRHRAAAQAAQIVAASRARRGDATMTAPIPEPTPAPPAPTPATPPPPAVTPPAAPVVTQRPDGVSETEWSALGDPGKTALVRERQRATAAEQALAATRTTTPPAPPKTGEDGKPDIAAIVQQAVAAAIQPFQDAQAQRDAEAAATTIRDSLTTAASARFHDATDALAQVDLTTLTDGNGRPDEQKITQALDDLLARKPHLGKAVDNRRHAAPGAPIGAGGGPAAPLDDRVKATLARMQASSGVKFAEA